MENETTFEQTVVNGFTVAELRAAFDRVKDADNWKNPIDRVLSLESERAIAAVEEAVVFFAGCVADVEPLGRDEYRIRAVGYYVAVGA